MEAGDGLPLFHVATSLVESSVMKLLFWTGSHVEARPPAIICAGETSIPLTLHRPSVQGSAAVERPDGDPIRARGCQRHTHSRKRSRGSAIADHPVGRWPRDGECTAIDQLNHDLAIVAACWPVAIGDRERTTDLQPLPSRGANIECHRTAADCTFIAAWKTCAWQHEPAGHRDCTV